MKVFCLILLIAYVEISVAAGTSKSEKCSKCGLNEGIVNSSICSVCLYYEIYDQPSEVEISAAAGTSKSKMCSKCTKNEAFEDYSMCVKCYIEELNGTSQPSKKMCSKCTKNEAFEDYSMCVKCYIEELNGTSQPSKKMCSKCTMNEAIEDFSMCVKCRYDELYGSFKPSKMDISAAAGTSNNMDIPGTAGNSNYNFCSQCMYRPALDDCHLCATCIGQNFDAENSKNLTQSCEDINFVMCFFSLLFICGYINLAPS
ncbi:uncharacterized protein LOC126893845 [Daktulosphaira vitifoliae]|uniref:uncharacterized protein LOC126893845 n=1 Tax=Daktulosphaira vitifoliae TaxID=58002 RepID=UPI0021AAEE18|nr:uncharacterized protein LOC126893845 [Daktulosphaira vitifoliae]